MIEKKKKSRRRKNRTGSYSIVIIVLLLLGVISVKCVELKNKNDSLKKQEAALEEKIQKETDRAEEIEELSKRVQTKQYAAEVARDQLGMVYPGELMYRAKE